MKSFSILVLFIFLFNTESQGILYSIKDSSKKHSVIDTNYIDNFKEMLNLRFVGVVRSNLFNITNLYSSQKLEYSINPSLNLGIGASHKWLAIELFVKPKRINNDNILYGQSKQFSIAARANARKFILDAFLIRNKGFYTTQQYNFTGDSTKLPDYIRRSDIENFSMGINYLYVFNNEKFSCAAPYSLTQKQLKRAGSFLLGTYGLIYSINADSLIFPDTLSNNFRPEVQLKNAGSFTWGIAAGYTYTFVIKENWFINLLLVPGISRQKLTTQNGLNGKFYNNSDVGLSMQSKFSIGYNKKSNFFGISASNNSYFISGSPASRLNYKFGYIRFYYGHRFEMKKKATKSI